MGQGIGAAAGGGMAYQLLQDLLKRRFVEEEAGLKQQNTEVDQRLKRDALTEDSRQFGVSQQGINTRFGTEQAGVDRRFNASEGRQTNEFNATAGERDARARANNANAARDEYDITPAGRAAKLADQQSLVRLQGDQAVRAAEARRPDGLTPAQQLTHTRILRSEYQKTIKPARELQQQLNIMDAGMVAARKGDMNAGTQTVIATCNKILDPGSVVRESEYGRSAEGLAMLDRMRGFLPKLKQGGNGIPADQLQPFADLARQITEAPLRYAREQGDQMDAIAKQFGLNPELITGAKDLGAPATGDTTSRQKKWDY